MIRTTVKMETPGIDNLIVDKVMDKVEGTFWKEFDKLKDQGLFTIKVLFFSYDISGKVQTLLERILGPRTAGV